MMICGGIMQTKITKRKVDSLQGGDILYDDEIKGFVVRRLRTGVITYGYRYRNDAGSSRWFSLGLHGSITADEARTLAKKRAGEVADGRDPMAERKLRRVEAQKARLVAKNTVNTVLDAYVADHVKVLRSAAQIIRAFDVYVRPRIGSKPIYELEKSDISEMLKEIRTKHGPVMGDRVFAHVRAALTWQASNDKHFKSPIDRSLLRKKTAAERKGRTRILDDGEIRGVWQALQSDETPECFRNVVRLLFLTAQRRSEVGLMPADEINGDIWSIPPERYKTGIEQVVPLTTEARRYIGDKKSGFMFTLSSDKPFADYSRAKKTLDQIINRERAGAGLKKMPHWTLHDIRRTSRSLMARAGVPREIAEQVLGHVIPGIEGVYNQHKYADEKRDALKKLAGLIDRILDPQENVIHLSVPA
jgi:integrase